MEAWRAEGVLRDEIDERRNRQREEHQESFRWAELAEREASLVAAYQARSHRRFLEWKRREDERETESRVERPALRILERDYTGMLARDPGTLEACVRTWSDAHRQQAKSRRLAD